MALNIKYVYLPVIHKFLHTASLRTQTANQSHIYSKSNNISKSKNYDHFIRMSLKTNRSQESMHTFLTNWSLSTGFPGNQDQQSFDYHKTVIKNVHLGMFISFKGINSS